MIRVMTPKDEAEVRRMTREAHPTWTERPIRWYAREATTIVLERDGKIIGYSVWGRLGAHAYGVDHYIDPKWRGMGLGHELHAARLKMAQESGAVLFVGITWPLNTPMIRILLAAGHVPGATIPGHYKENDPPTDAVTYTVRLNEGAL